MTEYGGPEVLHLADLATPLPRRNELQIRVKAVNIGFGDLMARNFKAVTASRFPMPLPLLIPTRLSFGLWRPRNPVLGAELSGVVEAVGPNVTRFRPGDEVIAYRGPRMGGNAEYVCMAEHEVVARKPANVSWIEAAPLPYGGINALCLLGKLNLQPGERVLILGASGGLGTYAVQLARHRGAEVTGVCGTRRVETVRALGAHHVIDYSREDFTKNGQTYDVILDVLRKSSFARCAGSLTATGRYVLLSFKTRHLISMLWTSLRKGRRLHCVMSNETQAHLEEVARLAEAGVLRAIVDRTFPLAQAAEAHRYMESGERSGFVVLTVS